MKIALSSEKNVAILSVSDTVDDREIQVLRAGIKKILGSGKNRIVLELQGTQDLSSDILRELAAFDALARELSGRVVLAGVSATLKTKIETFAKPPLILCFETRAKAIEFLTEPPKPEIPPAAVAAAQAAPAPEQLKELQALQQEQGALRGRLQQLEKENAGLREQIVAATIARRPPADEAQYIDRIQKLEAKTEKLLADLTAATAAAAAPKA